MFHRYLLRRLKAIGLDKIAFDMQVYEVDIDSYIMGREEQARQSLLKSLIDAEKLNIYVLHQ